MTKSRRWAVTITLVCGAERAVVALLGGLGISRFLSLEALSIAAVIGGFTVGAVILRRRNAPELNRLVGPDNRDHLLESEITGLVTRE